MKERKINYNRLMAVLCVCYILATVVGVVLNNMYYMNHLGKGLSPVNILIDAIPLLAVLPILMNAMNLLQVDERLPFLFFSLILVSFGLVQILFVIASLGSAISVYYIIDIISILLHMIAAVVVVLVIIGKAQDNLGVTCAFGAIGITVVLFITSLSIYDKEGVLYISFFPQLASCFSALLLVEIFFKLRMTKNG